MRYEYYAKLNWRSERSLLILNKNIICAFSTIETNEIVLAIIFIYLFMLLPREHSVDVKARKLCDL